VKLTSQDTVAKTDADFGAMAIQIGRHAWGLPQLTMREKAFIFIAADLCEHNLGFPLDTHIKMALSQGVALEALREAVRHLAPYAGYPAAAEALMHLAEIEAPDGSDSGTAPEPASTPASTAALESAPVPPVLDQLNQLDAGFAGFFGQQYAQRWNRPGLTVRERALCTIATDVLNGTLNDSFRLHTELARAQGADDEQIRAVLLLVAEYGISKAWQAYVKLDELLPSYSS
jgi:4-carboxymuconolactone decarboxylase